MTTISADREEEDRKEINYDSIYIHNFCFQIHAKEEKKKITRSRIFHLNEIERIFFQPFSLEITGSTTAERGKKKKKRHVIEREISCSGD